MTHEPTSADGADEEQLTADELEYLADSLMYSRSHDNDNTDDDVAFANKVRRIAARMKAQES